MSRVLVVDDEAIITMQLEERLSALGYDVVGMAASGEDSLEKARRLKPDIVLMDIVMPGRLNGIDAAKVINEEMGIPVVFVTSYADDAIIEKAKNVKPYGYIVKPFNELEVKAAIEIALFRRAAEQKLEQVRNRVPSTAPVGGEDGEARYLDLPEIKTLLLRDIFTDIFLYLYTDQTAKDPVFKFAIEAGLKRGGRSFFAYSRSTLQRYFLEEIQKGDLITRRIKKGEVFTLMPLLDRCAEKGGDHEVKAPLRILLDFSETEEFSDIVAVKNLVLAKKEKGIPISGIIALNIGEMDHTLIKSFSEGVSRLIVSTGKDTMLSFAHQSFPADSVSVVPQATLDEVVKKSLEPVVLSLLAKPISGYDIVREIHSRYKVLIPQARIYTLLYDLEKKGYLEMKTSGKSKLYSPTEKGRKHIRQKLNEFKFIFQHILEGGTGEDMGNPGKNR
jgi:CheY-like chemotaxis protein/DNA-binding PadR family transcriptional regulator